MFAAAVIIAALALCSAQTVLGAASGQNSKKIPIFSVERPGNKLALTFNAAWGADDTGRLLQILEDNNIKSTFFVCGYWAEKYPDELRHIYNAGHEIGNHGDTHAHVARLDLWQNKNEIKGAHEKVKNLLGIEMDLYRPPYGEYTNTVIKAAEELNYFTIQWDVDTIDTNLNADCHKSSYNLWQSALLR